MRMEKLCAALIVFVTVLAALQTAASVTVSPDPGNNNYENVTIDASAGA